MLDALPDLIAQGMRPKQIAGMYGVSLKVVYRDLALQGIPLKRRRALILAAIASGAETAAEIAGRLKVTPRCVNLWLERLTAEGAVEQAVRGGPYGPPSRWRLARAEP